MRRARSAVATTNGSPRPRIRCKHHAVGNRRNLLLSMTLQTPAPLLFLTATKGHTNTSKSTRRRRQFPGAPSTAPNSKRNAGAGAACGK